MVRIPQQDAKERVLDSCLSSEKEKLKIRPEGGEKAGRSLAGK